MRTSESIPTGESPSPALGPRWGRAPRTALAMLVAEELEVPWDRIRVVQGDLDSRYGEQFAGGSAVVRTSWRRFGRPAPRLAGYWKPRPPGGGACRWRNAGGTAGAVHHIPSRRTIPYGALTGLAAKLTLTPKVGLKEPDEFHRHRPPPSQRRSSGDRDRCHDVRASTCGCRACGTRASSGRGVRWSGGGARSGAGARDRRRPASRPDRRRRDAGVSRELPSTGERRRRGRGHDLGSHAGTAGTRDRSGIIGRRGREHRAGATDRRRAHGPTGSIRPSEGRADRRRGSRPRPPAWRRSTRRRSSPTPRWSR